MTARVYLDYNATTPLAPEVVAAMKRVLSEIHGNPSSVHWAGRPARDAVERARSQVAALLCCDATEVVFTSGGTEANNAAIKGVFFAKASRGRAFHCVTTTIEHPAVLEPCGFLEGLGAVVTRVAVDQFGVVDPDDIERAIRPETALISVMHANNEVGSIQPLSTISEIARSREILFHSDAAQSVGKVPVDVEALGVDLLSVAGHKFYAPKGVGALYIREGVALEPLLHGAGHEAGRRAGTENILEIVGLGAACEMAQSWIQDAGGSELRDALWNGLTAALGDGVALHGHPTVRLPNTLNVGFRGINGAELLAELPYLAASTGSACHAGVEAISPVLAAMGVERDSALGAVRFSLGRESKAEELKQIVSDLVRVLQARPSGTNP